MTQIGDEDLSTINGPFTKITTKVDNRGFHLAYSGDSNIEKASFTLLRADAGLKTNLITTNDGKNTVSPIFATAGNGGTRTYGYDNNGLIFNNSQLGLLVGSLAKGARTGNFAGTGSGFEVFLGLRNGVFDTSKSPTGQPIIFDLNNAETDNKKKLPGVASQTTDAIDSNTNQMDIESSGFTAGEAGSPSAIIGGHEYKFAGAGKVGNGVITVGGLQFVPEAGDKLAHFETIGRIIRNVAPGLISAKSTDAVNGSQLYAMIDMMNRMHMNRIEALEVRIAELESKLNS